MNRERNLLAAALAPGLIVAALSLIGFVPTSRDLPGYFFPLRHATAQVLRGERSPFWVMEAGCGEPLFANPQSALLYPTAWLGVLVPVPQAVGLEIGLHLAVLAFGTAVFARALGASGWWPVAAGWGVVLAGPTLDSAGVLNNLTTLAWLPWLWWATLRGRPPAIAGFLALAILGAEPQLAAGGALVALVFGPWRRTLPPLILGGALVAVQLVPFLFWVVSGDRTVAPDIQQAMGSAVWLQDLPGLLLPGVAAVHRPWRFVLNLTLPLWVCAGGLWAVVWGSRQVRRAALGGVVFLALSLLPESALGAEVWLAISRGLLRYPGRWLFLAVLLLTPAAAAVASRFRPRLQWGIGLAAAVWLVGLGFGLNPTTTGVQAVALGAVIALGGTSGALPALAACAALVPGQIGILSLSRDWHPPHTPCLEHQLGSFRVYSVEYSHHLADWVAHDPATRRAGLGMGYHTLVDGRRSARSYGPLSPRPVTRHLAEADRGHEARWWLDSLGAARFVSFRSVSGFPVVCRDHGVIVMVNPQSWPLLSLVRNLPVPGELPVTLGTVEVLHETGGSRVWRAVASEPGILLWLEARDRGWRVAVNGRHAEIQRGAGILQGIPVSAGEHLIEARYRPPGVVLGLIISLSALGLVFGVSWGRT